VVASIAQGRTGVMPAWGEALGASGVENVLDYVLSLSGRTLSSGDERLGAVKFAQLCAACHGADGRGNPQLGAPNLTDGVWLHGGSIAAVRDSIEKGRGGAMPAHAGRLGDTRVNLLAAYVLSLGAAVELPVGGAADVGAAD
jgi:cytochrome c oxidase cbb3-type subunit 3